MRSLFDSPICLFYLRIRFGGVHPLAGARELEGVNKQLDFYVQQNSLDLIAAFPGCLGSPRFELFPRVLVAASRMRIGRGAAAQA